MPNAYSPPSAINTPSILVEKGAGFLPDVNFEMAFATYSALFSAVCAVGGRRLPSLSRSSVQSPMVKRFG